MIGRRILAIVAALLVGVQAVRNAAVNAYADTAPQRAASLWSGHPSVELSQAMVGIAQASRDRRPIGAPLFGAVDDVARKAPLQPAPFLVRGVQAQLAGNAQGAERAFSAAQRRDPRSLPAAYFLAEHYFRSGDQSRALDEMLVLARLAPGGLGAIAPYVAAYARSPANRPRLRQLFHAEPRLEDAALAVLAGRADNADIVLALASPRPAGATPPWLPSMLSSLITAGQYGKAKAVWLRASGLTGKAASLVTDPGFADKALPPPFNWELTSSAVGLAERQPGGRLHLIFYGQQDGALARQLLVLGSGSYRVRFTAAGAAEDAQALNWTVRCADGSRELGRWPVRTGANQWGFSVPPGCAAQWIELAGRASDVPRQSDLTISGFSLERGGSGA